MASKSFHCDGLTIDKLCIYEKVVDFFFGEDVHYEYPRAVWL